MKTLLVLVVAMTTIFILSSSSFAGQKAGQVILITPLTYSSTNSGPRCYIANMGSSSLTVTIEGYSNCIDQDTLSLTNSQEVTVASGKIGTITGQVFCEVPFMLCKFTFTGNASDVRAGIISSGNLLVPAE
jgi:hypothetical protein